MQSSTFEQFAAAVALEWALNDLLASLGIREEIPDYASLGEKFCQLTEQLQAPACVELIEISPRRSKRSTKTAVL